MTKNVLKVISFQITKPPPEVRKILRRDSTCQTMTDTLNDVLSSKNGITNGTKDGNKFPKTDASNGKSKMLSNSEVDAKLTRLLSECESAEDKSKLKEADVENNATTTTAETGTTMVDAESSATKIDIETSALTADAGSATTDVADSVTTKDSVSFAKNADAENKTAAVNEDLTVSNGNLKITKEDAEKEEERIVIEQIDVAVKDEEEAEEDIKALKTENVEAQPSNCPMSVQ